MNFFKNSLLTLITNILNFAIALFTSILIARLLGPDKKGVYTLVLLIPGLIITFVKLGLSAGTIYFTGKKRYSDGVIIGNNLLLTLFLSLLSLLIGLVLVFYLKDSFFSGIPAIYLYYSLLTMPLTLFIGFFNAFLQGKELFKRYNSVLIINKLLFLLTLLFLLYFSTDILLIIMVQIFVSLVTCTLLYFWTIRPQEEIVFTLDRGYLKGILGYSLKTHISNVITYFSYRLDILLINLFSNPLQVGFYSISVTISEKIWIISSSISAVLLPRISSLTDDNRKNILTAIVSRINILITLISVFILYFFSDYLIVFLYSDAYLESILPLKILLIGIFSLSFSRILSNDLAGRGKPIYNTYLTLIALIINIILNVRLIPEYGIEGAAVATAVSYTVKTILTLIVYCRITGARAGNLLFIKKDDFSLIRDSVKEVIRR